MLPWGLRPRYMRKPIAQTGTQKLSSRPQGNVVQTIYVDPVGQLPPEALSLKKASPHLTAHERRKQCGVGSSAMDDATITVGLLISYVVLGQYVFRFQRTTLGITRQIGGGMSSNLQIALTPGWVGALGWLSKLVMLAAGFMVWRTWGWIPLSGFALYAFVLGSFADVMSPFPT